MFFALPSPIFPIKIIIKLLVENQPLSEEPKFEFVLLGVYHYLCGFFEKEAQAAKKVKSSSTGVPERACL